MDKEKAFEDPSPSKLTLSELEGFCFYF